MKDLTIIPVEFDSLKDYIIDLTPQYVTFSIPRGVVKYSEQTLRSFFEMVDIDFHYWPELGSHEVTMGILKPKCVSHTVKCHFKQAQFEDVALGVKKRID